MNKRLGAIAVAAIVAAAGLFSSPSNSAANTPYCKVPFCIVALTGTGPSPSNVTMHAANGLIFANGDSVSHTVVFANGLCTLTVPADDEATCKDPFTSFVGSYPYTVDDKFPGTVGTTPLRRFVTLTARTHNIRGGTRLTLRGRVSFDCPDPCLMGRTSGRHYVSVVVLARDGKRPFQSIATVNPRYLAQVPGRWSLTVRPGETTTYIARVTGQLPQGRLWTDARSRPFTVRIRH
jgi:hypothetical protein